MLSLRILPRSINHCFKQSTQQLHSSIKLLSSKDSSSSTSDSSDSDSDKEDKKTKKQIDTNIQKDTTETLNLSDTNERLNALLQKIAETAQNKKDNAKTMIAVNKMKIDVAIKPKEVRFKKAKEQKPIKKQPFEEQLKEAAKDVAKNMKGNSSKTELELLSKVLNVEESSKDKKKDSDTEETSAVSSNLSDLLSSMKIEHSKPTQTYNDQRKQLASKLMERFKEPSIAESLLYAKSMKKPQRYIPAGASELKNSVSQMGIFQLISSEQIKDTPQLSTWEAMEKREMKLATLTSPQNVFEELIQWTEEGKIWHFPINNEQGLEKEQEVHFSEHVFMEHHLKGWCPRKGAIRHFMELVCTGLSKNPYMTVEEKVEHITWYKNYFEDKKDLLLELGVLDDKPATGVASNDQKQISA